MKILMVLSRFPYPLNKGDKLRAYHQLKHLGERHELHLICLSRSEVSEAHLEEVGQYCASIDVIAHKSLSIGFNLFRSVIGSQPYQVNFFRSAEMREKVRSLILEKEIDVCFVQLIRAAGNVPFGIKSCKFYLDYMDAFSKNMERRLPYYSGLKRKIFGDEMFRVRKFENELIHEVDGACFISSQDAKVLRNCQVDIVPNGVDDTFFRSSYENRKFEFDIVFTGNMSYHPNEQACKSLVNDILPILREKGLKPKVCLVGINPTDQVKALASDQVVVTGFVEDIKTYLEKSKIFVAPLFSGTGLQNKLLESLAMQVPTLTTPLASAALNAEHNEQLKVCADPASFAREIEVCLSDKQLCVDLATRGQEYVQRNFRWIYFNKQLEDRLLNLVS